MGNDLNDIFDDVDDAINAERWRYDYGGVRSMHEFDEILNR